MLPSPNIISIGSSAFFHYHANYRNEGFPSIFQLTTGLVMMGVCETLNVDPVHNIGLMVLQGWLWAVPGVGMGFITYYGSAGKNLSDRIFCLLAGAFITLKFSYSAYLREKLEFCDALINEALTNDLQQSHPIPA